MQRIKIKTVLFPNHKLLTTLKTQHVIFLDYGAQEKTNDHHHSDVYRLCDSDVMSDRDDMFRLIQGGTTAKVPDLAKGRKINLREVTASC